MSSSAVASEHPRLRVCYIIAALVVGGAERQLHLLLRSLDRRRIEPYLIAYAGGPWEERFRQLNIPIKIIPYERGAISALFNTWRELRTFAPRVVHTYGQTANYIGRMAAILAGVQTIIISERSAAYFKSKAKLLLDRILAPFTNYLIANSKHAAKFYLDHKILPSKKVVTIKNGIEPPSSNLQRQKVAGLNFVNIGDFRGEKNHATLLRAMAEVTAKIPEARLHLLGDGPLREEIMKLAQQLGIERNLNLHGFINNVAEVLTEMDVYVHTAHYEGLPNAVMEAMLHGVPCIALASAGCCELIQHNHTGLLVAPGDEKLLAHEMLRLIQDPSLCDRLASAARHFMLTEFSVEKMVTQSVAIYAQAIGESG